MNPANSARATLVAAVLMLAAGPLHRFGVIGWQASLGLFVAAALLAGIGACWCLYQLLRRRGGTVTVIAAAAGFAAVAVPIAVVINAGDKPPINDISTDTTTPAVPGHRCHPARRRCQPNRVQPGLRPATGTRLSRCTSARFAG